MAVDFSEIVVGSEYSRPDLAGLWGYAGFQALARGVVTPRRDNKIILFVTSEKQSESEQYDDKLDGNQLYWEGPTDHYAERRILLTREGSGEEIHLFYRDKHHQNFVYQGKLGLVSHEIIAERPSRFVFDVLTD